MVISPRLPALLRTSLKRPRVDDVSERPRIEECLPEDALEAIMGQLDPEALCTARLVSKTFCAAASAHICNLTLASTSKAVSFRRFPHPRHVTVTHSYANLSDEEGDSSAEEGESLAEEGESLAHLDPVLRDLTTALSISLEDWTDCSAQTRDYLSQAALMPKLRKLEVLGDVKHGAALLARCTNLEALALFDDFSTSVARTIVTMTRLTSLVVGRVLKDGDGEISADASWLGQATNLRNLQVLCINTFDTAPPLIGNLTGLTGLTMCDHAKEATYSIAPLTRLTRLRSLYIADSLTESNLRIACSLGSGSLVNLALWVSGEALAGSGSRLSQQTALTRLSVGGRLCTLRHIGALRIELLQSLAIHNLDTLDAEGLSVLCRATSLTNLRIVTSVTQPQMGLTQVLARLTQLRSLSLISRRCDPTNFVDFPLAVSCLTALTELELGGHGLDDGVLRALLVFAGLRALDLTLCNFTHDLLPELGVLTGLNTLTVSQMGFSSLDPVSEVLDPLRKARGLPPTCGDQCGGKRQNSSPAKPREEQEGTVVFGRGPGYFLQCCRLVQPCFNLCTGTRSASLKL